MLDTRLKNNTHLQTEKKILLVEHDLVTSENIISFLQEHKHDVVRTHNGILALDKFKTAYFDLIIIDKNLPFKDAEVLTTSIRNAKPKMPIIYISDKQDADPLCIAKKDFEKQFDQLVNNMLTADSEQVLTSEDIQEIYHLKHFTLDTKNRLLQYKDEKPIKLSPKENKLLRILIQNKENLVTKDLLVRKVWYNDELFNLKSIGVYITKLRKLLRKDPSVQIINVYKTGFILTD